MDGKILTIMIMFSEATATKISFSQTGIGLSSNIVMEDVIKAISNNIMLSMVENCTLEVALMS